MSAIPLIKALLAGSMTVRKPTVHEIIYTPGYTQETNSEDRPDYGKEELVQEEMKRSREIVKVDNEKGIISS